MFNPSAPMGGGQWDQWVRANQQAGQAAGREGTRRFDQEIKARKYAVDQQYRSSMLQAKTERERLEVQRWYWGELVRQTDEALGENARQYDKTFGLNEGELTGWYSGKPTLARERQQEELGFTRAGLTGYLDGAATMERQQLEAGLTGYYGGAPTLERERFGVDTARIAAEMRSRPDMLFQYRQFAESLPSWLRGGAAAGVPGAAPAQAVPTVAGGAPSGPQGQTIPGQLAELSYLSAALPPGGAAAGTAYGGGVAADPVLSAMGQQYQRGFRSLGAQSLEGMDPNERAFLASAGTFLGWDPERAGREYQRSRLGQSVGG